MTLPKVLIIGQPFNNNTGGGITLSNLFCGWDREKLAVVCSGYSLFDDTDTKICDTYYQLGFEEHKWVFPFNLLKRKYSSGLVKFDDKQSQKLNKPGSKYRVSLIMHYFIPFLRYVGLYHCLSEFIISQKLRDWIDEFKPDVIYAQTTSRADNLFCISLQSYLNKPLVYHMMDDWPSIICDTGLFKNYWNKKIDHEFRILLDKSKLLLSICDYMSQEYKVRYNKDFIAFHNPINIDYWKMRQRETYDLNDNPTILYAGRIGLGIDNSLELIARAVKRVNEDLKLSLTFIIQSKEKPSWIYNYKNVLHNNFVPYSDLPQVFSDADFLLLPYDFSRKSIKYIQFSMPTKAPEFMISGTPIIIFAPEETAIVKYAKEYEWAKVITENSINAFFEAIKQLIENKEIRTKIGQNAIRIAEKNHRSTDVINNFRKEICSIVGKG